MEPILITQVLLPGMDFFLFSLGFLPDAKQTATVRQDNEKAVPLVNSERGHTKSFLRTCIEGRQIQYTLSTEQQLLVYAELLCIKA